MTWLSPAFPVGAFSYSSGIEWAVEAGDITDAASLRDWLAAMLGGRLRILRRRVSGAGASRRVARRTMPHCARSPNWRPPSCPRASASSRPRRRAAPSSRSRASAWTCDGLDEMIAACGGAIVYPVAVGLVSAAHAIPLAPAMHAFLHALVSNWISAGARLVPLGQTDSQRVLASARAGGGRDRKARARSLARRSRQRHLPRRSRQPAPRDAIYEAVPVMNSFVLSSRRSPGRRYERTHAHVQFSRPASDRHRWSRRLRQDRADGPALQVDARALRHRRDHQRHLHQMGCGVSGALGLADAGPHRRRRDRRLPAHRDPRGRLDESRRGRRHAREISQSRSGADRIRRRQSRRDLFARTRRSHDLRHRRRRRRQDPLQGRARASPARTCW